MTMINTSTLISASQVVDAVQNYVDWNRLYMNTKLFALMNNLGLVSAQVPTGTGGKGNYRILYNKATGVKTDYTLSAAIADVGGGKINLKTTTCLDAAAAYHINPGAFATELENVTAREGLALRVIGTVVDGAAADKTVNALLRITAVTSATDWTVETIESSLRGVANADTCTSIKIGSYILLEEVAEFGGSAPTADDMTTTQDENYIQMFDSTYGKNLVALSQLTKYDSAMETLYQAHEPAFYSKINTALWFGQGSYPTTGHDYGNMKGIWKLLNLADADLNTASAKPIVKVDSGTTFDFWKFADVLAERGTDAPSKLHCYTTSKMSMLIEKAAFQMNKPVDVSVVQFPKMSFVKRSVQIGDTELIIIVDDKLKYHPTFKESTANGAQTAAQEHVMICLDPRNTGITYHNNAEYGVMIPAVRPVLETRDKRTKEEHIIAALTLGVWNLHQHVAYGITNS